MTVARLPASHAVATLAALALAALSTLAPASTARAQWRGETSGVATPASGIAGPDDAFAVALDPASVAFLDRFGLAYVHADAADDARLDARGDALYAASPLLFGVAAGVGVDSVRPTSASRLFGARERTRLSFALAYRLNAAIGLGASARVLFSGDPAVSNLFTLDLAASWRPLPEVAVSFVARDLTGPGFQDGTGAVPRAFVLALGVRPDGTRAFTLDLAGVLDERGQVGARVAGELEVPFVGRLVAAGEFSDVGGPLPDSRVTVGASVDWGHVGVGAGVFAGSGLEGAPGGYATARLDGAVHRGAPTGDVLAEVVLEGTGPRALLSVVARLEAALRDPRVRGVLLRPRGSGIGLAYAQELRLLIATLEDAGKPVVCHLEDASGAELYACAGASAITGDPAGGVRLYGPSLEVQHYAGLLRELGVRADFVRIGRFKSAIEAYQDDRMSADARAARESVLDELSSRLVHDLSLDLGVDEARVQALIDAGPYVASDALDAGLLDGLADAAELDETLREVFHADLPIERAPEDEASRRWGREARVGVVVIDGEMTDGENVDVPLLELHTTGGRTAARAIDALAADPAVAAIVLRVDSPGGSVLAADQIWRAVERARRRVPVVASMGSVAASGGYYVSSACDEIWADPATVTGSIGVWFGKVDLEPLATRFGVVTEELRRGAHANAESLFAPFTPEERALLADAVRHWYRTFLRRVAEGRGMTTGEVHAVAEGRVWTGDRALELGLVDRLGGFASALARARQLARLPADAPFEVLPARPVTVLDYVLGAAFVGTSPDELATRAGDAPLLAAPEAGLGATLGTLAPEVQSALRLAWTLRTAGAAPLALWPVDPRSLP